MLVTDVANKICWRQVFDFGDGLIVLIINSTFIVEHWRLNPPTKRSHQDLNFATKI